MRVSFLVDGFNLYHSIRAAERATSPSLARFKKKTTQASLSRCQFFLPGKRRKLRLPFSGILVAVKGFEERPHHLVPELGPVGSTHQFHQVGDGAFISRCDKDLNLVPTWSRLGPFPVSGRESTRAPDIHPCYPTPEVLSQQGNGTSCCH